MHETGNNNMHLKCFSIFFLSSSKSVKKKSHDLDRPHLREIGSSKKPQSPETSLCCQDAHSCNTGVSLSWKIQYKV